MNAFGVARFRSRSSLTSLNVTDRPRSGPCHAAFNSDMRRMPAMAPNQPLPQGLSRSWLLLRCGTRGLLQLSRLLLCAVRGQHSPWPAGNAGAVRLGR